MAENEKKYYSGTVTFNFECFAKSEDEMKKIVMSAMKAADGTVPDGTIQIRLDEILLELHRPTEEAPSIIETNEDK